MGISILNSSDDNSGDKIVEAEQFIETETAILEFFTSAPGSISKWHHHGDYEIFNYIVSGSKQFILGSEDSQIVTAKQGDLVHVGKNTAHRDSNPFDEPVQYLLIRIGKGQSLFPVEGPSIDSTL